MVEGIIKNLGVTNKYNTKNRQQDDFYTTDPQAVQYLLQQETFNNNILEPMVGTGVITEILKQNGYTVTSMDIKNRGYTGTIIQDFLKYNKPFNGDIITNPPYKNAHKYVLKAINIATGKVAMLLKIQFLETITRYEKIFKHNPPSVVYCFVKRIACYKNGDYEKYKNNGSAICFCWIIWDNALRGGGHDTIFRWIPNHKK